MGTMNVPKEDALDVAIVKTEVAEPPAGTVTWFEDN